MIFQTVLLGGLLAAGHASAKVSPVNALFQRSDDIENILRRDANLVATLTRRQDSNPADSAPQISTTPQSGNAAQVDLAKWEDDTKAACGNALSQLNGQASNPAGIAVCYNLPFLDNQTGVFQAELRMYNVSAPINPWVGVTAGDINMGLSYDGAQIQNMAGVTKRDDAIIAWQVEERDLSHLLVGRQNNGGNAPGELKVISFVGKINPNLMGTAMNENTLRPLLIPKIQISAKTPTGQDVSATLSSNEASFVNGVFNKQATPAEAAAASASASAAAAKATPFVLPGTSLAFFPVGLVITCVWTGGFFLAVGLGTIGRIQFREQYRRRVKREMAMGQRTI